MKKEEANRKSQEKNLAIQNLCRQLEVQLVAKQIVTEKGFIENVVVYMDVEKYNIDKEDSISE